MSLERKVEIMRKLMMIALLVSNTVFAQEVQVLSIVPRMVTVQQQQCQQVTVQQQDNSTAGTVIGGVAGGIIGNQVGRGHGREAATALGAVVGALAGNNLGGQGNGAAQSRTVCNMVPVQVQQGKLLTFMFEGRQYQIQTP
jgi:uncharacterized protein YcfJ